MIVELIVKILIIMQDYVFWLEGELHKDYLFHLFDIFKPFCGMPAPSFRFKFHKKTNKFNNSYLFKTLSYPCFNYYYDLFLARNRY